MIRNWLRAFFVVLIIVGGVWWYRGWSSRKGEISQEATQVEVKPSPTSTPKPIESKVIEEEHKPVNAGISDWELSLVVAGSLGLGLVMWGLYKATYRIYWFG